MRCPFLDFALWASCGCPNLLPGNWSCLPRRKYPKRMAPEGLPADTDPLLFSPFRALAELAGVAAPVGWQIQLKQYGSLNPKMAAMLGCANGVSEAGDTCGQRLYSSMAMKGRTRDIP